MSTRIRRDNKRDALALGRLYADEDTDRGFLARQVVRLIEEAECVCGEINARHCPVHQDARPPGLPGSETLREVLKTVDGIEDALARYFADKDVPMEIRQAVDAFEIARAALSSPRDVNANGHRLVLEIAIPGFYVDGETQEAADEWYDGKILPIVLNEWMREDVGLTFVSIPGEKEQNSDFEAHAMNGRIVGARIESPGTAETSS